MNEILSAVLRWGVYISGAIFVSGIVLLVLRYGFTDSSVLLNYLPDQIPHSTLTVAPAALPHGILAADPSSVVELGVLGLLATPVARVLLSIFLFAAEGDGIYVRIATALLVILLFSILITPLIPLFRA